MTKLSLRVPSTDTFISGLRNAGFTTTRPAPDVVEFRSGSDLTGRLVFKGRHERSVAVITERGTPDADRAMRKLGRAFPTASVVASSDTRLVAA